METAGGGDCDERVGGVTGGAGAGGAAALLSGGGEGGGRRGERDGVSRGSSVNAVSGSRSGEISRRTSPSLFRVWARVRHAQAEVKVLSALGAHPFVVRLRFAFRSPRRAYIVTDLKPGGSLFQHLQKGGPFSEDRARFHAAEVLLALHHIHKSGFVYRDLKPENILLDMDGHAALCDFGLAVRVTPPQGGSHGTGGTSSGASSDSGGVPGTRGRGNCW
ncbi:unnamed protein product, partial [Discosporangium mesarthrocarpum]